MGLKGRSFLPRGPRKSKKKLAENQAMEDSLREEIEVAENREQNSNIELEAVEDRIDKAVRTGNILREKIRILQEKLERINEENRIALEAIQKLQEKKILNDGACAKLEKLHDEEPERRRKLQVELYRTFRDTEQLKTEIVFVYGEVEDRFDALRIKGKMLKERERHILLKEKAVRELQGKIRKQLQLRKSCQYHKQRMKEFIVYVMKMNIHAALSRTHMVERRGQHLVYLIQNLMNELERTSYKMLALRKRKCETRPLKHVQSGLKYSEVEVGVV